jgi:hypothetical protein
LVTSRIGIGINWIDGSVAGLSEGSRAAIGSINGIEKGVQEAASTFETGSVKDVIGLEEDTVLWIDDGI